MTAITMAPKTAERLIRVCGLMGSHHVGEAGAAAMQATKLLQAAGLSWQDLLEPIVVHPSCQHSESWRDIAAACLARRDFLTSWEAQFLVSLPHCRSLSPKQITILERLHQRVRACGAAR